MQQTRDTLNVYKINHMHVVVEIWSLKQITPVVSAKYLAEKSAAIMGKKLFLLVT